MTVKTFDELKNNLQKNGQILALDIGTKRIGVAISDDTQTLSSPKTIIKRFGNSKDFVKIQKIVQEYKIIAIIIGLPLNMDDSFSKMSYFTTDFANNLDYFFEQKIPITLFDERLTSFAAQDINCSKISKKQKHVDDIAASIILESFLVEKNL